MKPGRFGNGQPQPPQITAEQVAAINAQRAAEQIMRQRMRRDSIAGIVLNGICSGLYARHDELVEGFGARAVADAVKFADALIAALDAPPPAPEAPQAANEEQRPAQETPPAP